MSSKKSQLIILIISLTVFSGIIYKLSTIPSHNIPILSFRNVKEEESEPVEVEISSFNSSWIDYRNNWNGEILINIKGKQILLTDEYIQAMESKGQHPLTQIYPKFSERRNSVKENCGKIQGELSYELNNGYGVCSMRFNDDYEVLNCVVPKATASTLAKKFSRMIGIDGKLTYSARQKYSLLTYLSQITDTARRVQTYTKFFIYRHPFERLVSAYGNKFGVNANNFILAANYAKQIISVNYLVNKNYFKLSLEDKQEIKKQQQRMELPGKQLNITFLEFVTWVAIFLDKNILYELDMHWTPITHLCNPCVANYDIIIDHDFVVEESQILVDYLQKNKKSNLPIEFEKYTRIATRAKCNEYFSKIPQNLREKLYEIFRNDFIVFSYSYNGDSQDYACEEKTAK
ncbi:Carbohydrate sulfotransferase 11 [Oopsacas minuta]|uniref:Carbohydrate sulfotransferase n=1 Tax=Oopsacas minuta TaxID=111878 RepID=A0AAV7JZ00_9METZ|nr:Carbohydrate sulfotransferase 11 [Oopsacas minuta]